MTDMVLDESKFLQLIQSIQQLLNVYEQKLKDQPNVIILVGVTGAGKSTVFNFLCGGEYTWSQIKNESQLVLKENSEIFAQMNGGMNSVTKEPKYFFNQKNNHLIIDFPGFKDTNGELDQILIQMLFQKIVSKSKVKLVYVIRHPETRFNERGVGLQDFIKMLFQEQQAELNNICLLLNSYGEKLPDQQLKESVKKQLSQIFKSSPQQICILRKCKNPKDIEQIFSNEKRDQLLTELIQINEIQFFPKQVQHSEKISQYLSQKNFSMFNSICEKLNFECMNKIQKLEESQIINIKTLFEILVKSFSNQTTEIDEQYLNFITQTQKISAILSCQNEISFISGEFSKIYSFFSQFDYVIEGCRDCQFNKILAQNLCKTTLETIIQEIALREKKKQSKQVEQEKLQAENEKRQAEYQYQQEVYAVSQASSSVSSQQTQKNQKQQQLTAVYNQNMSTQSEVNTWSANISNLQQTSQNEKNNLINEEWNLQRDVQYYQQQFTQAESEYQKQTTEFNNKKVEIENKLQQCKNQIYDFNKQIDSLSYNSNQLQNQVSNLNYTLNSQTSTLRELNTQYNKLYFQQ